MIKQITIKENNIINFFEKIFEKRELSKDTVIQNEDKTFQNYIKQIIALDKAYTDTNDAKKQKKILKEYDKIAKIIWSDYSKYNITEGSYDKVNLKALNLKSLDRGVIITKIEE